MPDGGGIQRSEREGGCFGANNTRGISLNGNSALNVRSNANGDPATWGGAQSDRPWQLGTALSFLALSENDDAAPVPSPVHFEVRLLSADGGVLATHVVQTNLLTTSPGTSSDGCLVGEARDGSWSRHVVDTSAFQGQEAVVEFRQHTNVPGKGFFTLVDDVVMHGALLRP